MNKKLFLLSSLFCVGWIQESHFVFPDPLCEIPDMANWEEAQQILSPLSPYAVKIQEGRLVETWGTKDEAHEPWLEAMERLAPQLPDHVWLYYARPWAWSDSMESFQNWIHLSPIVDPSRSAQQRCSILVPDGDLWKFQPSFQKNILPWERKISRLGWLGPFETPSLKDNSFTLKDYSSIPPMSLVMLGKAFPQLIHAQWSSLTGFSSQEDGPVFQKSCQTLQMTIPPMEELSHYQYRLIFEDPQSSCLDLVRAMDEESVVFFNPHYQRWCQIGLVAHEHYAPVDSPLQTLVPQLRQMRNSPEQGAWIAENARSHVLDLVENLDAYFVSLLKIQSVLL